MTGTAYPGDAVAGVPTYTATQGRSAFAAAMGGATTARPLGGFTGIRPGTPSSILTIPTNTTWQLTPFGGYIDLESPGTTGGYFFSFQANETGNITAAAGSARVDLLYVRISDSNTGDGSALSPRVTTGVQDGIPGSGVPALTVTRAFVIAQINVPLSGGGSPTFTWVAPYTVGAGSILPVLTKALLPASATLDAPYAQVFADATTLNNGLYQWTGAAWVPNSIPAGRFKGTITTSKAVGVNAKWGISTGPTFDSTDDPQAGFSSTTGLYTCKIAGTYLVMVQAKANTSGFTTLGGLIVQKNGTNAIQGGNDPNAGGFMGLALSGYLRLAVGDTVSCQFGGAYTSQSDSPADNNYFELVQVQN